MIKVHCLAHSRAIRVVWLLEELGTDYELVSYPRTDNFLAPPELKDVHPLGNSPVIEHDGFVLAESAAILRYVAAKFGAGRFVPTSGSEAYWLHDQWLDYVEGSLAPYVVAATRAKRTGGEVSAADRRKLDDNMAYLTAHFDDGRPFLLGDELSLADIQMSYIAALADYAGLFDDRPKLKAYWQRLEGQPALQRATEKGGDMKPPEPKG